MKRLRRTFQAVCASIGFAATCSAPVSALDRSFSINPTSLFVFGGVTASKGIELPKSNNSFFIVTFVVSLDHATNSPIHIRIYMQKFYVGPCTAGTLLSVGVRSRVG